MIGYICGMEVPKEVITAAGDLVKMYGPKFSLLGERDGLAVYCFEFPKDTYTGFPFLFLYGSGAVQEVTGDEALELIASFGAE